MKTIKPALILTLFLTVASTLLIVASKQFVIDRTILNDDMKSLCVSLMGEGEYRVATDYAAEGFAITESDKPTYIVRVIVGDNGALAIESLGSGYAKDGVDALVVIGENGKIKNVGIVALGETPGFGDRVKDPEFMSQFLEKNYEFKVVKSAKQAHEISAVSGATRSSKGAADAVNKALVFYNQLVPVKEGGHH